jgi:hypothetical protein
MPHAELAEGAEKGKGKSMPHAKPSTDAKEKKLIVHG